MPATPTGARKPRGFVRQRGKSFQIIVYGGEDPVTGKDIRLTETTRDPKAVEKIRTRLLAKIDEQRSVTTKATVGYLLDRWLPTHDIEEETRDNYRWYIEHTIRPAIGHVPLSKINTPRVLEELYADLRRCRARCDGKPYVEHRTHHAHECLEVRHRWSSGRPSARARAEHDCTKSGCVTVECTPHVCKPASVSTVRQVNAILSAAFSMAVRWEWMNSNPAIAAKKPKRPTPQPAPPTAEEAARIATAAWDADQGWGTLVWLCMMTGLRRGELAALRWTDLRLPDRTMAIERSYSERAGKKREKDTKTHQARLISLDPATVELLETHWNTYAARIAQLGLEPDPRAFVFSTQPDHSKPYSLGWISHRYKKMCVSLGIDTHLHALRHYSATELIAAGVDIRTVAGRLGHAGGGTTTLRVYAAWKPDADRSAAALLANRMSGSMPKRTDAVAAD